MPAAGALDAVERKIVDSAVVDDVGDSDGYEGVDLDVVRGDDDGDDAHHEASSAAVIEDFILILTVYREVRH